VADGEDPVEAELAIFGVTHFELGGWLLKSWGFKDALAEAIASVPKPAMMDKAKIGVATVVHIARALAGPLPGFGEDMGRMALDMDHLRKLGLEDRLGLWMIEASKV
jgi:HD-like signal output (HDOD) protein